jgi:hypothetical protein
MQEGRSKEPILAFRHRFRLVGVGEYEPARQSVKRAVSQSVVISTSFFFSSIIPSPLLMEPSDSRCIFQSASHLDLFYHLANESQPLTTGLIWDMMEL